jgi:hypothetical protein
MARDGLYAELFTLQARQYVDVPRVDRLQGTSLSTIDAPTFLFGADFPGSLDGEGGGNAAPPLRVGVRHVSFPAVPFRL